MRHTDNMTAIASVTVLSLIILGRQVTTPAVFSCLREDTVYYLNWTRQAAGALAEGVWYPRWMPDSHGGYGSPVLVFYPPLVILLTAALRILTGDVALSVSLVKLTGLFFSGLFMYLFAKDLWGGKAGLVAAAVYMLLPARVFDLYFTGVYASKFAYVWFPLILYFAGRAAREGRIGPGAAGLAAGYALLCVTHLLSAYMFAPVIFAFGLAHARSRRLHALLGLSAGCALGIMLAGFYLLPVLIERGSVHLEAILEGETYHYWNNYLFFVLKAPLPGRYAFYPYMARTVVVSIAFGTAAYLLSRPFRDKERGPLPALFFAVVIGSLFLMSSPSGFLWESVPGLNLLQFPTRWASVTVFGIACLAGAGTHHLFKRGLGLRETFVGAYGLLFIASLAAVLYYDAEIVRSGCSFTKRDIARLPAGMDVVEYVPKNVSLSWLRSIRDSSPTEKDVRVSAAGPVRVDIMNWGSEERVFTVESDTPARLRVRTFFYPGWLGFVDGAPVSLSTEKVSGAITLDVPAGKHEVRLRFSSTVDRKAGLFLSAASALAVMFLAGKKRSRLTDSGNGCVHEKV